MLPSTKYFSSINCPFYDSGLCERPYCHFRHVKPMVAPVSGVSASALQGEKTEMLQQLVSEVVKKVLTGGTTSVNTEAVPHSLVSKVFEELKPISLPKHRIYKPSSDIPDYRPTPIAELKRRQSFELSFSDSEDKYGPEPTTAVKKSKLQYIPAPKVVKSTAVGHSVSYTPSKIVNEKSVHSGQECKLSEALQNDVNESISQNKSVHEGCVEAPKPLIVVSQNEPNLSKEVPVKHESAKREPKASKNACPDLSEEFDMLEQILSEGNHKDMLSEIKFRRKSREVLCSDTSIKKQKSDTVPSSRAKRKSTDTKNTSEGSDSIKIRCEKEKLAASDGISNSGSAESLSNTVESTSSSRLHSHGMGHHYSKDDLINASSSTWGLEGTKQKVRGISNHKSHERSNHQSKFDKSHGKKNSEKVDYEREAVPELESDDCRMHDKEPVVTNNKCLNSSDSDISKTNVDNESDSVLSVVEKGSKSEAKFLQHESENDCNTVVTNSKCDVVKRRNSVHNRENKSSALKNEIESNSKDDDSKRKHKSEKEANEVSKHKESNALKVKDSKHKHKSESKEHKHKSSSDSKEHQSLKKETKEHKHNESTNRNNKEKSSRHKDKDHKNEKSKEHKPSSNKDHRHSDRHENRELKQVKEHDSKMENKERRHSTTESKIENKERRHSTTESNRKKKEGATKERKKDYSTKKSSHIVTANKPNHVKVSSESNQTKARKKSSDGQESVESTKGDPSSSGEAADSPESASDVSDNDAGVQEYSEECDSDDSVTRECYRIFQEYKPERNKASSTPAVQQPAVEEGESTQPQRKRIAHQGVSEMPSRSAPPPRPFRPTPAQSMHERWLRMQELFHKRNGGTVTPAAVVPQGKKRVARVPNPALVSVVKMNMASQKTAEANAPKQTIAQTLLKGQTRTAHRPSATTMKRPVIPTEFGSKVPTVMRQKYLNALIDECLKMYDCETDAFERALEEEKQCYGRSSNRIVYRNVATNAVLRLRREGSDTSGTLVSPAPSNGKISHLAVLAGKKGAQCSWSMGNNKTRDIILEIEFSETEFFQLLQSYLLTDEQLKDNGFPRPHATEKGRAIVHSTYKYRKNPSTTQRYCVRCGTLFTVDCIGFPVLPQQCEYHWGRRFKTRGVGGLETRFTCCKGDAQSDGCCIAPCHVSETFDPENLTGFVRTLEKPADDNDCSGVFALDCEMCYTTVGLELTRVTVIGIDKKVICDLFCKPDAPILDYNTRFSGITQDTLKNVTSTLRDVQAILLSKFSSKTILIGHSLESDLKALKLIHDTVVDTSVVFPHKMGPPFKMSLKMLCSTFLSKIIQEDVSGHDSTEDAVSCMELMLWKVKEDLKTKY